MQSTHLVSEIDKYVIEKVKQKRIKAGLTQYQFAQQLAIPRTYISMVESGRYARKYSLEQINDIARVLKCDLWDLLPKKPV